MSYIVDPNTYVNPQLFDDLTEILSPIIVAERSNLEPYLFNIAETDSVGDLTGVHPRYRDNVAAFAGLMYDGTSENINSYFKEKFKPAIEKIESMPGIVLSVLFFIAPNSIVPTHIHDMDRPAYDNTDYYNIFLGLYVPSTDVEILGAKIDNEIHSHAKGKAFVFDSQVPHSAWNNTNEWWLSILMYIKKDCFNENIKS